MNSAQQMLRTFAEQGSVPVDALAQYPALLSVRLLRNLQWEAEDAPPQERAKVRAGYQLLADYRSLALSNSNKTPIGIGPLEELFEELDHGRIPLEQALEKARTDDIAERLSAPYVIALSRYVLRDHPTDIAVRRARVQIIYAAVEGLPRPFDDRDLLAAVTLDLIELTSFLLAQRADGRLYREAMAYGERALPDLVGTNDALAAEIYFRLAALNMDPFFTARKPFPNFESDFNNWQYRFAEEFGPELQDLRPEEWKVPAAETALARSERYYAEAATHGSTECRRRALKGAVLVFEYRRNRLDQDIDVEKCRAACDRALAELDPAEYPHQWLSVTATRANLGDPVPVAQVKQVLAASVDALLKKHPPQLLVDMIVIAAALLEKDAPDDALAVLARFKPVLETYASDANKALCFDEELRILVRRYPKLSVEGDTVQASEAVRAAAVQEKWDPVRFAVALLQLARRSSPRDEELAGLKLIQEAAKVAPEFFERHRDPLQNLRAELALNLGVTHYRAKEWAAAIPCYGAALKGMVSVGMTETARNCLEMIEDLSRQASPDTAVALVREIAPMTLLLHRTLGEASSRLIQRLCDRALWSLLGVSGQEETIHYLVHMAKGHRFAATLGRVHPVSLERDPVARRMLHDIAQIPEPADEREDVSLDEDKLLTAYVSKDPVLRVTKPAEARLNLQHAFDRHVSARLLEHRAGEELRYLDTAEIQAALDENTALMNVYVAAPAGGESPVWTVIYTREAISVGSGLWKGDSGDQVPGTRGEHRAGKAVAHLRKALVREIEPKVLVAQDADQLLASTFHVALGNALGLLPRLLDMGKTHLCIVPHGPLHFLPYHLLPGSAAPLADVFTVTYLPNLHLLADRAPGHKRSGVATFGPSTDMPAAVREAAEIAGIFGTPPKLEEESTRAAVLEALGSARCIHLSAHGRHNVAAPAFQEIELAPDDQDDGRLFAYEVAGLDLRGVDLVTLSACESALGRFDTADNLRGLPAAFFGAGVKAIVGTLWSPEVETSRCFFVTLYASLAEGATLRDAFRAAQQHTRQKHPQFRDWGPFYLMGRWDVTIPVEERKRS